MFTLAHRIVLTIAMSTLAVVLYLVFGGKLRKTCMYAMFLSSVGDIFMADAFSLGFLSLVVGGTVFMLSHVVFALGFLEQNRKENMALKGPALCISAVLVALSVLSLGYFGFFRVEEPDVLIYVLVSGYLVVIGFNMWMQFAYALGKKGLRLLCALGILLFLVSDYRIFLNLVGFMPEDIIFVWATYVPAQVLVLLFCRKLSKGESV